MNSKVLLHLTHTDVRHDARILKEIDALGAISGSRIIGVGVAAESKESPVRSNVEFVTIRLITKVLRWLPRVLRYAFYFVELFIRMTFRGVSLKPDVVHCHDTLVLPMGVIIKLFSGAKLVYDAHELESEKTGQTRILSRITLVLEKLCWRWVDLFISVSDSIIEWYRNNFEQKPSVLILNAPDVSVADKILFMREDNRTYFRDLYGIPWDKKIFIYLGMLSEGRGIRACLTSFADPRITDHVIFMGEGILADLIDEYSGQHDNIHRHQPVPHDQVVAVAGNADYGLCFVENASLSYYYCLPNKLFEYAFAGLPVLASDFPEIRRVIDGYSLGVCCAPEVEDIKRAVSAIREATNFGDRGDLTELAWPVQAERLVQAYNTLL